eukprot:CAMPEP_0172165958 /NCGR_PEP_ID=MMETSP1050-20130122/8703_1 /TAXON_ID=233186 /ORGANISM="Cryptomonas curvata, Strain CCAP979/52" /LENGTH=177 /DNA_ID=CAMNT_0012836491 /DNA_START=6 /DNA_END=537 /DNA_ORIENTATION=-
MTLRNLLISLTNERAIDYDTPRENYYVPGWKPYYHRFNLPIAVDDPDMNGWWLMSDAEYMSGSGVKKPFAENCMYSVSADWECALNGGYYNIPLKATMFMLNVNVSVLRVPSSDRIFSHFAASRSAYAARPAPADPAAHVRAGAGVPRNESPRPLPLSLLRHAVPLTRPAGRPVART